MILEHEEVLMNKEVLIAVFILKWICFSELSILGEVDINLKECFNKTAFWGFLSFSTDHILIGLHVLHLTF